MSVTKQAVFIGDNRITDINAIYARVIGLLSSSRDIDIKDVLSHELAPVPTSMFTSDGMRIATNKSQLKKSLEVEVSSRNSGNTDVLVIDGSALLWVIHCPEAHALSGCNTVVTYFGIGKGTVIRVLRAGHTLSAVGDVNADLVDVCKQAIAFIGVCYGMTNVAKMSEIRLQLWASKNDKGVTSSPKL
ncbi:Uncharacterised protein at_DN0501 [Pycnogonum litorale]